MDFKKHIPEIEKKINYTFKDKSLLTQAFTRTSFCNEHRKNGSVKLRSNEVLEFFGDSVLSTAIISLLMNEKTHRTEHGIDTELSEGDFSNIRSKLSDKRHLSSITRALGMQAYLLMGEGDEKLGINEEPSVMEDLFESIIGAVYIDCGMNISTVTRVVSGLIDISAYSEAGEPPIQSYKNALQEFCADKKNRLPAPLYKTVSESGPDHRKVYERGVYLDDRLVARGKGKNQKLADAAAAEAALKVLKEEKKAPLRDPQLTLTEIAAYAKKNKLPSPEFRDKGESVGSNDYEREHLVECRLGGRCAIACGRSKQEARAAAAEKILEEMKAEEKKKSHPNKAKSANEQRTHKITPQKRAIKPEPERTAPAPKPKSVKTTHRAAKPKKAPSWHKKRS